MHLSRRDFEMFNEGVAQLYCLSFSEGPVEAIARMLPSLVGGMEASVGMMSRRGMQGACAVLDFKKVLRQVPVEVHQSHPRQTQPDLLGKVVGIADLLSRREWERHELRNALRPFLTLGDDLGMNLRLGDGSLLVACVMRERRTFREREREMLTLLVPHLRALLGRECAECEAASLGSLGLTKREQEVLLWVAEGKTNAEVGQILGIRPGTVRIHLEHIYPKLGVENRHGATLRVMDRLRGKMAR